MKLQKYIAATGLLFFSVNGGGVSAQKFSMIGHIDGQKDGYVHLYYQNNKGRSIADSAVIKEGNFQFTGDIMEPTMVYFADGLQSMSMNDPNTTSFFVEPGEIRFNAKMGDIKNAVITGSATQQQYAALEAAQQKLSARWKTVMDTLSAVNKRSNVQFQELKDWVLLPYDAAMKEINYTFFAKHPQSYVTAFELRFYTSTMPLDSLQMYYHRMNASLQQSTYGKELAKEIEKIRAGSPGSIAANFTTADINGQPVTLSDFKGKYVILDFWASWCVPCRKSNPHMIELYKKYHDKGLEIIGIADDDNNHGAWKKAVEKDGVGVWYNVLRGFDLKKMSSGEKNEKDISEKFGIHSLPTKILIDRKGVIIGRYDQGTDEEEKAMDAKLKKAFTN
ncbi:TlpA disulfide reductase family protein [Arachidicoccus sp.]|uniref:TlpA disulfide reductase family protein n=1 Tax=Arachidicoccus sp. TaxID=1872624 RepID=UPI003D1AF1FD